MSDKITCPKCGSDQLTADKKGFSGKKAVAGAVLTGGIGLLAGTIGSNQIKITCMACGNSWEPKQYAAQKQEATQTQMAAELTIWKNEFYRLYESGDKAAAQEYYLKNTAFSNTVPDIDAGYKRLKEGDSQTLWLAIAVVVIGVVIVVLIAKWLF